MQTLKISLIVLIMVTISICASAYPIKLNTEDLEDCFGISSFICNSKGDFFLYSMRMTKVFKFSTEGKFVKSFCSKGVGPGEVQRVLSMFHNPTNDFLYLPEYASGIGRISVFDSNGEFKGNMKIDLNDQKLRYILSMIFLDDGSFYTVVSQRVAWDKRGKIYLTKQELSVLYFDKKGNYKATVYTDFYYDEVANKPRWGGPRILFRPTILTRKMNDGNICIGKTDDNKFIFVDKTGKSKGSIKLEIERVLLSDEEFKNAKNNLVEAFIGEPRMNWLAKRMIKLDYKPSYHNFYSIPGYFIVISDIKKNQDGYPVETLLTKFDDNSGKPKGTRKIKGYVMGGTAGKIFVKEYNKEGDELFRVEELNL